MRAMMGNQERLFRLFTGAPKPRHLPPYTDVRGSPPGYGWLEIPGGEKIVETDACYDGGI